MIYGYYHLIITLLSPAIIIRSVFIISLLSPKGDK